MRKNMQLTSIQARIRLEKAIDCPASTPQWAKMATNAASRVPMPATDTGRRASTAATDEPATTSTMPRRQPDGFGAAIRRGEIHCRGGKRSQHHDEPPSEAAYVQGFGKRIAKQICRRDGDANGDQGRDGDNCPARQARHGKNAAQTEGQQYDAVEHPVQKRGGHAVA